MSEHKIHGKDDLITESQQSGVWTIGPAPGSTYTRTIELQGDCQQPAFLMVPLVLSGASFGIMLAVLTGFAFRNRNEKVQP